MARMARAVFADIPHHATQRGNRRQQVFFKEEDYCLYKSLILQYCKLHQVKIRAYCLMPNHVHLVLVPSEKAALACAIGEAHRRYTRSINFRKDWRGYLWQGRFASFPMDEKYLYSAVRYVECNPVKANLVSLSEQWKWSGARAHLQGKNDDIVDVVPMLERVEDRSAYLCSKTEDDEQMLRLHERTGRPLGSDQFVDKLEILAGRRLRPAKPGPKPSSS